MRAATEESSATVVGRSRTNSIMSDSRRVMMLRKKQWELLGIKVDEMEHVVYARSIAWKNKIRRDMGTLLLRSPLKREITVDRWNPNSMY